ncbi:MAG: DUF1844 domain-containing protein [Candidatus Caldatribacteriota bacterium]|nr:DUF1844 domain-containing protein [Candidatus Caldatribacteriota bacterium]
MNKEKNEKKKDDTAKDKKMTGEENIQKEEKKNKVKEEESKESKEERAEGEKKYKEPDLPTLFIWFISMLSGKAWEHLGLMMNPDTKETKKDLKKAKIAIDTVSFLYDKIKDELLQEDIKRVEDLMSNLKMNYVEKLKEK